MVLKDDRARDEQFEEEVRRIARLLYPDPGGGSSIRNGRERDGIFITSDQVVVIEATRSRALEKARKDGAKLRSLTDDLAREHPFKAVKAFFVTEDDPTADQRDFIKRLGAPLQAISFKDFNSLLVDATDYIRLRDVHQFGSARDPESNGIDVKDEYVPLDFLRLDDSEGTVNPGSILEEMRDGRKILLLGEFGTGKSMTLREVFKLGASDYLRGNSSTFFIHLNINDHQGQSDPTEALERHARSIGFPNPHQLVRAWRSGSAHLILDGFDEIFVPGWTSGSRPLRDVRRKSVALLQKFVSESASSTGVLIAGRRHFFDDLNEAKSAMGLPESYLALSATDFTESQVERYLKNRNWSTQLPGWLPRRPLLIGYLAGHQVLAGMYESLDVGEGWHYLLNQICEREARPSDSIDADSIRAIIERLATRARSTSSGRGPLGGEDLTSVFRELQGYQPDEGALLILQRLPGLQVDDIQHNTRAFIDDALVDAARAGDLLRWVVTPRSESLDIYRGWSTSLSDVGLATLAFGCRISKLEDAIRGATKEMIRSTTEGYEYAISDLIRLAFLISLDAPISTEVRSVIVPDLTIPSGIDCSGLVFSDCMIESLDIDGCRIGDLPFFNQCHFESIDGASSIQSVEKFHECTVSSYADNTATAQGIRELNITNAAMVRLITLKKIYLQAGAARKESALYRGLPEHLRGEVPAVLEGLVQEGLAERHRRGTQVLYSGVRAQRARVVRVLSAPKLNEGDPLLR